MNINRKYIIIFGSLALLLVIITGAITYYKEKKNETNWLNTRSEDKCENFINDNQYIVCCIKDERFYNCTKREEFGRDEEVEIIVNPAKIQNIPEGFNYACLITDIWRKQPDDSFILFPEQCFYYKSEYLWRTRGLTPTNDGVFSLLKVNVYPDSNKDIRVANEDQEGTIEASDQFIIFNLEAKISKE